MGEKDGIDMTSSGIVWQQCSSNGVSGTEAEEEWQHLLQNSMGFRYLYKHTDAYDSGDKHRWQMVGIQVWIA